VDFALAGIELRSLDDVDGGDDLLAALRIALEHATGSFGGKSAPQRDLAPSLRFQCLSCRFGAQFTGFGGPDTRECITRIPSYRRVDL
jgi:hypothetical protein